MILDYLISVLPDALLMVFYNGIVPVDVLHHKNEDTNNHIVKKALVSIIYSVKKFRDEN